MHATVNTKTVSREPDQTGSNTTINETFVETPVESVPTVSLDNVIAQPGVAINARLSVLLCGNSSLGEAGIADKLHVVDRLGRRKLRSVDLDVDSYAQNADVLWLAPKKYWTVSKGEVCLQDTTLAVVDCFLLHRKDIVIVTDREYRWRNKDPAKLFHRYETPGHVVFCSRKLDNLCLFCGPSDNEQLLNTAIATCLSKSLSSISPADRVGVRQSYQSQVKSVPDAAQPKMSRRRAKQSSKSPDSNKARKQVKFASDEFDLGDHATNDDKPTAKPNYAKENMREKQKAKKHVEPANDDCGDNITAIEFEDDSSSFAVFEESSESSTACPDSDSDSHSFSKEETATGTKVYLSGMDELFLFLKTQGIEASSKNVVVSDTSESLETHPYFSHDWKKAQPHTSNKLHVVEIFGGHGGVTRIAIRRGLAAGQKFDLNVGIDLLQSEEKRKLFSYIELHKPNVVVCGPPCTAFGPWARYNRVHAWEAWARSYAVGLPLAELCAAVAKVQMRAGRLFLIENPWSSELWNLPCFQELLPYCYTAYCEQCCFGLTDMDGNPTLKPTAFVSNSAELVQNLNVSCNGRHSYHAPLAGTLYGVSKTAYAQRWPYQLCNTIVQSIERVCFQKRFQSTRHLKAYVGEQSAPTFCPGCKSHTYRRDPRHNRIPGVCRFPDDEGDVLQCAACKRNLPSHHPSHSHVLGECHWAEAIPRLGSSSSSSRGPRPQQHIVPDQPLSEPSAPVPPKCSLGGWLKVYDSYVLDILESLSDRDGWHELGDGSKALVMSNTRFAREPQPRFRNDEYPVRSTYGKFVEHPHANGTWWQVEESIAYAGKERHLGYPVEILIHVFQDGPIPAVSPTENKIRSSSEAPPNSAIGEPAPLRKRIQPMPQEKEYGEEEPEVPEVRSGRELAVREEGITEEEQTLAKAEQAEEEKAIAKAEQIDWSSVDLGTALRELKSENKSLATRALRKLHLRWYHAPATRMKTILSRVGVPKETLQLTESVCDTCRICRAWQKPSSKAMGHLSQSEQFNERVQLDLLFVGDYIILHLCDEATRFSVAEIVSSKEPDELLKAIKHSWIKYFGVPKLFVSDSEGALGSEEAGIWAERIGTSFKVLPRYSHATTVERHHETLRQLIHRIAAQCKQEGLTISMSDVVAEATIAKNSLLVINGYTPYTAVLGRNPNLLGEFERPSVSAVADNAGGRNSKYAMRLREIAVASMVENSAKERIKRAEAAQTRIASEQLELKPNDLVDIYRTPRTKDNTGWRGPCRVISTEEGQINVQWGGRVISCRPQDVRRALMYPLMLLERNDDAAFNLVRQYVSNLINTSETFGIIHTDRGWELSQAAKKTPSMFYAVLRVAHDMFLFSRCVAARVGRGIAHTNGLIDTDRSILVWWPVNNPQLYRSMSCSAIANLNLKELFGDNWQECCWIRFFGVDEEVARIARQIAPDVPYLGDDPQDHNGQEPPAEPVPLDEDDVTIRDDRSVATRLATPMDTEHGGPPHYPPRPPHGRREPVQTDRSRSTRQAPSPMHSDGQPPPQPPAPPAPQRQRITPVHTDRSRSTRGVPSSQPPQPQLQHSPTTTPVSTILSHKTPVPSSQQATTGSITPKHINSPRGDKREPTNSTSSNNSLRHTPKHHRHNTPASGSQDPMPATPHIPHEPILPIIDDDDEDLDDDATIAQFDPEDQAFVVNPKEFGFASEAEMLFETQPNQQVEDPWQSMFWSTRPPPQYHDWELHPGLHEFVESQQHYLEHCKVFDKHCEIRKSSSKDECCEVEVGPAMAAWFVGAPKLESDEILVFKATSEVASAQIEKNFDALTPQEMKQHFKLVEEAIRKEIASFAEHKTFVRALRKDCTNVCTSRWVLRWKEIDGVRAVKARLTIRGFQDLAEVPSYASTASRWAQRLIVSTAVQKGWKLWVTDISTAFLQGMSFTELAKLTGSKVRDVAFVPPKGSEKYFTELPGLSNLNFAIEVLKLLKAAYGLRDAPRAWRIRLDAELKKLGGVPLLTDKSLYCFYTEKGCLEAFVSTHVDDIKGTGTEARTKDILLGLERSFGKLKTQVGSFQHCGLMHEETETGYVVHQSHYASQLRCIDTSALDVSKPDQPLNPGFQSAYLSLLGGLSWLIQTRLDIAIYVVALQRAASKATTGHLLKLNKLTKWVRRKPYKLTYKKLKQPCKLITISDSAFRTEPQSNLAMRGAIIGVCEAQESNRGGRVHVLEFFARKQRRVCRSTFAAELNGIADALEIARLINMTIASCYKPQANPQSLQKLEDEGLLPLPIEIYTDCRSVFDALASEDTKTPTESSLVLVLHMIKELLVAHVVKHITWVNTHDMLSDGLTKGGVSRKALFEFANTGAWLLKHECQTHFEKLKRPVGSFLLKVRQCANVFPCMSSEVLTPTQLRLRAVAVLDHKS